MRVLRSFTEPQPSAGLGHGTEQRGRHAAFKFGGLTLLDAAIGPVDFRPIVRVAAP